MPFFDAIGKGSGSTLTLQELERNGNNAFAQLPTPTQNWADTQAKSVVRQGAFGPIEQRNLSIQIQAKFSQGDQARILAVVRFLALRDTVGGSISRLGKQPGGLTPFQKQLIGNGS